MQEIIKGETYQKVTSEYNLITKQGYSTPKSDTSYYNTTSPYFTPLEDGWGRIAYDGTQTSVWANAYINASSINVSENKNYTVMIEIRNVVGNISYQINDSAFNGMFTTRDNTIKAENGTIKFLRTTVSDLTNKVFRLFGIAPSTTATCSMEFRIMIIEGDHTSEELTYKEYTPNSPTPEYPSEVKNIKGIENLFDKSLKNAVPLVNSLTELETGIKVTCNVEGVYRYAMFPITNIDDLLGKNIIACANVKTSSVQTSSFRMYYIDEKNALKSAIKGADFNYNDSYVEIRATISENLPSGSTGIALILYSGTQKNDGNIEIGDYIEYTNLRIVDAEAGANIYTPYGSNWLVDKTITSKNLLDMPFTESNKLTKTAAKNDDFIETSYNVFLEANKTYTFSCETDGTFGNSPMQQQVYLLLNRKYNTFYNMDNKTGYTFTPTVSGYYYIRYDVNVKDETHSFWNFQIEEGSTKTDFEPYKETIERIDLSGNELCNIGDYFDELNTVTGKLIKRVGKIVLDGDENWVKETSNRFISISFQKYIKANTDNYTLTGAKSNMFIEEIPTYTWRYTKTAFSIGLNSELFIRYDNCETAEELKQFLASNPVTIYYILREPIEEILQVIKSDSPLTISFDDFVINELSYQELNNTYKLFTNNNFYLGGTASNQYSMKINKEYSKPVNKVKIKEGSDVKAILYNEKIDDSAKEYNEYTLTDGMVNFEFKYDASLIFEDGKTTVKKILQDICDKAGIKLATQEFLGQDMEVSWYDNTVTARTYISYIAELNGGFARINRNGELELVRFKTPSKYTISLDAEDYTIGEKHKITRVVFDNGILVHKVGDETGNTLYLNTSNVFINDAQTVDNIYNVIKDFEFYSIEVKNYEYKDLLAGDIVTFTDGVNKYPTIAQYELTYFGTWYGDMNLQIKTIKQEETQVETSDDKFKRLIIKQNQAENEINILAETNEKIQNDISGVQDNLENNYYNKYQAEQLIINSANGLTNTFSEAGGNNILRNTNFSATEVLEEGQSYEYWYGNIERQANSVSANGYSILLKNGSLSQQDVVANGVYTISFYYRNLNNLATLKVKINDELYQLENDSSFKLFQTGLRDDEGNYITNPINITDNYLKIEFICDKENGYEIYDIMCNAGSIKLAYSQNQNETITETVNISKGVTVTSTTSKTKTTMNTDGFRIKNLSNEDITKFTDKGTETNDIIVSNEATIVGILRQRVGEQVWDSLI